MAKNFDWMENSNHSPNRSIHEVSEPSRRVLLKGGLGTALGGLLAPLAGISLSGCATSTNGSSLLGFKSISVSTADAVMVPEGYIAEVIAPWGEPVGLSGENAAFKEDASNTAAEQEIQFGMHHDGMHYFAHHGSTGGLLVMNHEYVDEGLLFKDGQQNWSLEKVRKSQAAHGVSVCEIEMKNGQWQLVRPSPWARRITANTPMVFGGPAAGHAMLKTAADASGRRPRGTFNNCASGITPWGTYLTCEENFIGYFSGGDNLTAHERRWGLRKGSWYRWHEFDDRFDAVKNPNEPNRFGWVVEIDPHNPSHTPVKRTALGRAAHEGATTAVTKDGRAVVYMGEDARFEYIYKFVSRDRIKPGGAAANAELLDHGTLYVAQFNEGGKGQWIALTHGQGPLTAANGFADQGEVLIKARQASDLLGATKMDRPEWISIDLQGWVYCTLTNNSSRGGDKQPGVDAANPRSNNTMGHIIRWKDAGDFHGERFEWNHFVLAGDPANERGDAHEKTPGRSQVFSPPSGGLARSDRSGGGQFDKRGNVKGDAFACPDGLWTDARGVLWIQTDMSTSAMGKGDLARLGNNAMLAADVNTGEIRRFLTGPAGCEITGATGTPDGRTMFINIQHPGESPSERSNPNEPTKISKWPNGGRPRSATVVIRKKDGGVIGT